MTTQEHRTQAHDTHEDPGEGGGHEAHGGHGDHAARFRDKFWLSLLLSVPVVGFSVYRAKTSVFSLLSPRTGAGRLR